MRTGRGRARGSLISAELVRFMRTGRGRAGGCLISAELVRFVKTERQSRRMPHVCRAGEVFEDRERQSKKRISFLQSW